MNGRSNSISTELKGPGSMLRLSGKNTVTFPKRERFNEDTESVIAEQRQMQEKKLLTEKNLGSKSGLGDADAMSRGSRKSIKSLSKSELTKFFANGQKKVDEDTKSRKSQISKAGSQNSGFKAKFLQRIED